MVKQNICEKAHNALTAYNDALTTNNALQIKNETAKKRAAKVSSAMCVFIEIQWKYSIWKLFL